MPSAAQWRLTPSELSFRVLQTDPAAADPTRAVHAIERFLRSKRAGLLEALEIRAGAGEVWVRAVGEAPEEMLREAWELMGVGADRAPEKEIEVDQAEFAVTVREIPEAEVAMDGPLLLSKDCQRIAMGLNVVTPALPRSKLISI